VAAASCLSQRSKSHLISRHCGTEYVVVEKYIQLSSVHGAEEGNTTSVVSESPTDVAIINSAVIARRRRRFCPPKRKKEREKEREREMPVLAGGVGWHLIDTVRRANSSDVSPTHGTRLSCSRRSNDGLLHAIHYYGLKICESWPPPPAACGP
jgi:hypothetical protein